MSVNNTTEHRLVCCSSVLLSYRSLKRVESNKMLNFKDRLSRCSLHKANRLEDVIQRNKKVISSWSKLQKEQKTLNRSEGHLFNPLFLMSIGETKHSELLGYLLKPWEDHGYGDEFLISFLKMLEIPEPERGHWNISVEKGRIDLLLKRDNPRSVVIIENKSNDADDQQHQLYRYWHKAIHEPHQIALEDYSKDEVRENFKIIYLPSGEHKTPEDQSLRCPREWKRAHPDLPERLPLGYELKTFNQDIVGWLDDLMSLVEPRNIRLRTYLAFYQELCKSL